MMREYWPYETFQTYLEQFYYDSEYIMVYGHGRRANGQLVTLIDYDWHRESGHCWYKTDEGDWVSDRHLYQVKQPYVK